MRRSAGEGTVSDSREATEARARADASRVELQTLAEEGCTGEHGDHHTDDCPTDDHYDCSCPQHVADRACNAVDGLNRVVATLRAERDTAEAEADKEHDNALVRVADDLRATRSRLDEAERLLREEHPGVGKPDCRQCTFLAASQPSPSTPVPLETGGGGAPAWLRTFTPAERLLPCRDCGAPNGSNGQHDWHHPFNPAAPLPVQPGEEPR